MKASEFSRLSAEFDSLIGNWEYCKNNFYDDEWEMKLKGDLMKFCIDNNIEFDLED